jgi:hypothetical protein
LKGFGCVQQSSEAELWSLILPRRRANGWRWPSRTKRSLTRRYIACGPRRTPKGWGIAGSHDLRNTLGFSYSGSYVASQSQPALSHRSLGLRWTFHVVTSLREWEPSLTLNSVLSLPYYVLVLMPVVRHSSWGWRWRPNTSHQPLASSYPSSRMSSLAFTGPYWIPSRSSKRLSVHRRANTCQRPQKHCIWYLYWRGKIFRNVSHTTASET